MKYNLKQLKLLDKQLIWHPFTQMQDWLKEDPLVITKGKGVYLFDSIGNKYIDGVSSLWVNIHGHAHKQLNSAIKKQIAKISHSTFLGLTHEPGIRLAKQLVSITPKKINKVFYSDSGSESVEIALKMAFQYYQQVKGANSLKKKTKFVALSDSYHGDTIGSVSVGGIDLFHKIYNPLLFKSYKVPSPYCYRCTYEKKCQWQCVKKVEDLFKKHSKTIAAFIIEPLVQGASGMIVHPRGYLKKIRQLCTHYNILLIADEVATGFGRTGTMFACTQEKVTPDILCIAKGITGGYLPLAATMVQDYIFKAFCSPYKDKKTLFHGHTYTANQLGCAVSLENISLFKKNNVLKKVQKTILLLKKELTMFNALKHVGDVRQCGVMVGIELVKDKKTRQPYEWNEKIGIKVTAEARKRGVIIRPLGNVIVIMPPLIITEKQLKHVLDSIYDSIKAITE